MDISPLEEIVSEGVKKEIAKDILSMQEKQPKEIGHYIDNMIYARYEAQIGITKKKLEKYRYSYIIAKYLKK